MPVHVLLGGVAIGAAYKESFLIIENIYALMHSRS
jgi:hypothetical protein